MQNPTLKKWIFLIFLLIFGLKTQAQQGKFLKQETFLEDLAFWQAKKTDSTSLELNAAFAEVWTKQLNEEQKKKVYFLSYQMFKRNFSPIPHIQYLWHTILIASKKKMPSDEISKFLQITELLAQETGYTSKTSDFVNSVRIYLKTGVFFQSKFNYLKPTGNVRFTFGHTTLDGVAPLISKKEEGKKGDKKEEKEEEVYDWDAIPAVSGDTSAVIADLPAAEDQPEPNPQRYGAYLKFEPMNLVLGSIHDTLTVEQTEGKVFFNDKKFQGKGGKVKWGRLFSMTEVSCDFGEYEMDIRLPHLRISNSKLNYKGKIDQPVGGIYEYKSMKDNRKPNPPFPRFNSAKNDINLKTNLKEVKILGGFSLIGKNITSQSIGNKPTTVEVSNGGKLRFVARSRKDFILTDSMLRNDRTELVVYIENEDGKRDSITHAGVNLYYYAKKSLLQATRDVNEYNTVPFVDSYHNIELGADRLTWQIDTDKIRLYVQSASRLVPAVVESIDYYDRIRFQDLQGTNSRIHPLLAVVNYALTKGHKRNEFSARDMCKDLKVNFDAVKGSFVELRRLGYINYDATYLEGEKIQLKPKGILYGMASNNRADYDKIRMISFDSTDNNALLDLKTKELLVNGVTYLSLRRRTESEDTQFKLSDESFVELKDSIPEAEYSEIYPKLKNLKGREFTNEKAFKRTLVDSIGLEPAVKYLKAIKDAARVDVLDLTVLPKDNKVIIKKNRDIMFSGQMWANGFANFYGQDFLFKYDSFKVNMPKIDSMRYMVKNDTTGKFEPMSNVIKDDSGVFYINNPANHSGQMSEKYIEKHYGKKDDTKYPVFESQKGGHVAFSDTHVLDGVYGSKDSLGKDTGVDKIRFDIEPYKMENLVRHDHRKSTNLKGQFKSDGIFPDFEENVKIMEDNSFGFIHNTAVNVDSFPKGFPLYKKYAKSEKTTPYFAGNITLNNNGIRSSGEIKYLTSTLTSNDFIYFPDSVTALSKYAADGSKKFQNQKAQSKGTIAAGEVDGITFPDVDMDMFRLQWETKKETMALSTIDDKRTFDMYHKEDAVVRLDQKATFKGTLFLNPLKLGGKGIFDNTLAQTSSDNFHFERYAYTARNASFYIRSEFGGDPYALQAENVKIEYDMKKREAGIHSEDKSQETIIFPSTQYKTSISDAIWYFDKGEIVLEEKVNKASFTSTKPDQDGLTFDAKGAFYQMHGQTLDVFGVDYIFSVDSKIFPDSGKVKIHEHAYMDTLDHSRLHINADHETFKLDSGSIFISSRKKFQGHAVYMYENDAKEKFSIRFDKFLIYNPALEAKKDKKAPAVNPDSAKLVTFARSVIKEKPPFIKQAGIQYKGEVELRADSTQLIFRGKIKFTDDDSNPWIQIDTTTTTINISSTEKDENGNKLGTGIFYNKKFNKIYTATRTNLVEEKDQAIFEANGAYRQDVALSKTIIEDARRILHPNSKGKKGVEHFLGNYFAYNKAQGIVEYEGKFDLFPQEKEFFVKISGIGDGSFTKMEYKINALISLNFDNVKGDAFKNMGEDLEKQKRNFESILNYASPKEETFYKLGAHLEQKDWENTYRRLENGRLEFADIFEKGIVLNNVDLHWDSKGKVWYSKGKIGLMNVMKTDLNIKTDGFVLIEMNNGEPSLFVKIDLGEGEFYMFSYVGGDLRLLSSNYNFNKEVDNPKSKNKFKIMDEAERPSIEENYRQYIRE